MSRTRDQIRHLDAGVGSFGDGVNPSLVFARGEVFVEHCIVDPPIGQ
jgi:hypothetical protein